MMSISVLDSLGDRPVFETRRVAHLNFEIFPETFRRLALPAFALRGLGLGADRSPATAQNPGAGAWSWWFSRLIFLKLFERSNSYR